ncbi:MAG TPA: hypothetical protein VFN10_21595 [Thermoanaerobaculia bacterium]|nr:hypothetical protein [Thermoanaerobaculia bacterium]
MRNSDYVVAIENEKLKIENSCAAGAVSPIFNFQFSILNSPPQEAPIA